MKKKVITEHQYVSVRTPSQRKRNRDRLRLRAIGGKSAWSKGAPGAFGGRGRHKNPMRGLVGSDKPYGGRTTVASERHVFPVNPSVVGKR